MTVLLHYNGLGRARVMENHHVERERIVNPQGRVREDFVSEACKGVFPS